MSTRARALGLLAAGLTLPACSTHRDAVAVGSKNFTEALLLGELYAQLIEGNGHPVRRRLDLGGTDIAMAALRRGEIDLYPEYTGTALLVVLKAQPRGDAVAQFEFIKNSYERLYACTWLDPAPMNNTQALATTRALAARYGLRTLSDVAAKAPQLRLGAVPEFVKRSDGLPGLQRAYGGFDFKQIRLVDFGLKYQALLDGDVDIVVAFGTDGAIVADDLVVMQDDKHLFPAYQVAPVVRLDALKARPELAEILNRAAPLLTDATMRTLNNQIDGPQKREPADVARDFIKTHGLVSR
ncbi:MAG: glycine betaine ABC transporter substrate-binding protein [Candidatus Lustribacter sp.]